MTEAISRRSFLKLAGGAAGTIAASTRAGQYFFGSEGQPRPDLLNIEPHIMGENRPFNERDISRYLKQNEKKEADPSIRTTEILIGHKTWEKWNNGEKEGKRGMLEFLDRHLQRLNDVLASSRPSSEITNLKIRGRVIVVDEDWLKNQSTTVRQMEHANDALGRWSIDENYVPENSKYFRESLDYGLLHEWLHYSLFLYPHLFFPFVKSEGWFWYLNISSDNSIRPPEILVWKEREMHKESATRMLVDSPPKDEPPGTSLLSEAEELYIRRMCKGINPYKSFTEIATPEFIDRLLRNDLASVFEFQIPEGEIYTSAKLITATAEGFEKGNTLEPHRNFRDITELKVDGNSLKIPKNLLAGAIVDASDPRKVYGNAKDFLIILGEGDKRKVYGFSGWHLLYWTWKEQLNHGESELGGGRKIYPIKIDLADFEI